MAGNGGVLKYRGKNDQNGFVMLLLKFSLLLLFEADLDQTRIVSLPTFIYCKICNIIYAKLVGFFGRL
ncbi:hypothetical protein K1719_024278 [Acacia pycnantha]|nr:hypothetical protein K1719_024278 [Acacia pycnantha]